MNNIWSEHVQGIMTLYLSRKLRFNDVFFAQYDPLFGLDHNKEMRILEIGCGPGALAEALHRWYPRAQITAIDRDSNFIAFAQKNIKGIDFVEGDATHLPFENESFDVTISNTVQEHIDPAVFWCEQKRVLKYQSEDELQKYGVGKYAMSEAELPASMEKYGFTCVTTGYTIIDLTPDETKYPNEMAEAIIEEGRQSSLEAIRSVHSDHADKAISAVNNKYDERLRLYRTGKKQWDTSVSVTMIVRGIK